MDQIHTYDLASNRLSKRDGRAGASWAGRDWEYGYDSLGRLTEARQGARTGVTSSSQGTWIPAAGGQEWVLDMLGNWTEQRTDLTGNGVFTDALDRSDARAHNLANELTQRVVSPTAGGTTSTNSVTLPLAYDAAGNLEEESTSASTKRRYTHDAWGRLVKVESLDASNAAKPLSTHRFNGLHWRIEKHWHAVADAADTPDRKTTFWYDAAWRVVQETQRDQTNGAGTLEESIIQQVWGARYIDDAVARMRVTGNGSGGVAAGAAQELAFQLTDAQFSVIAVATPGKPGVVIDRIAYSPYGEATRTLRSDVNGDGFVNQSDYTGIIRPRNGAAIGTANYLVEADLDRNGVINQLDYDISIADDGKSSSGGVGEAALFSRGVRNSIGYCGYIFNEDSGLYTVRFRTYSPTLGRWLQRDPAGYVDGMGLYEYVRGGPVTAVDPWGLQAGSLFAPPHGNQIYPKDPPRPALPDRWGTRKPFDPSMLDPAHRVRDTGTPIDVRRYEPRNDPANGCGITVRRAGAPGIKNIGHDWIEIDDPALNPVNGTAGLQGIGFWPKDKEGLFNAPSELYSPAAPSTNECTCKRQNDPYTGTVPAQIWPVRMAAKTHLKPRGGGIYEFWLTPAELPSGVPVTGANCEEIRDCVRSATVNRRFTLPIYNCRDGADDLLKQCGLTRYPGDRWTGDSHHHIIYPIRGPKY